MNFYSLPIAQQRLIAVAALATAILLAGFLVVLPVFEMISGKQTRIAEAEAELLKWEGIAASRDLMQAAAEDPAARGRAAALALPASTDAQAAASVQAAVRRSLSDASAELKSIQPLELRSRGALRETGVRVVALATHEQLENTLFAIDNASPRMFVREANIQLAGGSRRLADQAEAPVLQVRLDVLAYALPAE